MHESILSCSTAFRVILWFVQSTKLVQLHSVPHNIELCEWCTILFCRNLPIFLWPQVLHLDNSQFTNSKPLLYSTCTCKGWKETAITHWVSSQKHCTRKCIPQETTKVFSWKHSQSLLTTIYRHLCDIRHLPTSLLCLSSPMWQLYLPPVPLTGPGWCGTADFNHSLPGKCLFSSVSREPLPLSELSLWSMTRHIPVAVLLNLTHYISSLACLPLSFCSLLICFRLAESHYVPKMKKSLSPLHKSPGFRD